MPSVDGKKLSANIAEVAAVSQLPAGVSLDVEGLAKSVDVFVYVPSFPGVSKHEKVGTWYVNGDRGNLFYPGEGLCPSWMFFVAQAGTVVSLCFTQNVPLVLVSCDCNSMLSRLSKMAPPARRADGRCPTCGVDGTFVRMALCCPQHGAFAGI